MDKAKTLKAMDLIEEAVMLVASDCRFTSRTATTTPG